MFPPELYQFLKEHNLIEIKGGVSDHDFLEIWIVEVDGRLFARSWNKSARSWFTAFLATGVGKIRYGEKIIEVTGRKVSKNDPIQSKISDAYLKRFDQAENVKYAVGIAKPEYFDFTMEFFPV